MKLNRLIYKNWRFYFVSISIAAMLATLSVMLVDSKNYEGTIKRAHLNLANWNADSGVMSLSGEWEFYWQQLLTANDFPEHNESKTAQLVNVPQSWATYEIDGKGLSESGYATYRLSIQTNDAGQPLSIKLVSKSSAYKVYLDNQLIAVNGQIGTDKMSFEPGKRSVTVDFVAPSNSFNLIIQASNYQYPHGGMTQSILLGTPEQLKELNKQMETIDLLTLGVLLISFIYSLCMYFINRRERINLYFAVICLVFIGRVIISGSYFIYSVYANPGLRLENFINYYTSHVGVLAFALMIRELFPNYFSKRIRLYLIYMTVIIVLCLILFPDYSYTRYYIVSDILCLIPLVYGYYVTVLALMKKQPLSLLVSCANSLILILIVFDFYNAAINEHQIVLEFSKFGFLLFILLYAIIIGRKFSLAYNEIKLLSEKLLELDKLKDEFLANTSHELRTPLHGIISISESLLRGVEGQLTLGQANNLRLVHASSRKLSHLIDDLLDMSKLKHMQIVLNRTYVQLAPLTESIVQLIKQMHQHKPIEWKIVIPNSLPPVYGDENRIVQMLYNVIGNAAKFTDQGKIRIEAAYKEGNINIQVMDTGIGIEPLKLNEIFKPFEQGDRSITRPVGGVGLGLSITKQLVELHGGQIEVSSTPHEGSCFTLILPAHVESEHMLESNDEGALLERISSDEIAASSNFFKANDLFDIEGSGEHILVIDDDYMSLQATVNLLKLDNYKITAVTSGEEALQKVKQISDLRLVIVDVMMPGMSGYEVCSELRTTYSFVELPILMVTAKHKAEDLVQGYEVGANDFLMKPFEALEFRARVRTLVEWKQSMNRAIQSELAFLQAQIKPHFIYNTLNTISYFCTSDGEKAKELLNSFANYLRTQFDFKDLSKHIQLEQEIDVIKSYLAIEKERFGERLTVEIEVDREALKLQVPPFIIQPLVENAVLHGVLKKIEGGLVRITIKVKKQTLHISIFDNGIGMTEEAIDRILAGAETSGVGLKNIQERLKKLYDEQLYIHSRLWEGTEIIISIPISKGGSNS